MSLSLEPFALPERYRLEGGIAAGGMASVYAAHDTVLDRPVAVKVLADHLNDNPTARARFEREARAAASVSDHPSVVTIFDVGEFNGRAFIVMERREGGTIEGAGRVGRRRAMEWLGAVADALDAAHARGIVHRDIKPGNLLLDDRGRVGVADFGIASLAHDTGSFTQTGEVLGTAAYLSPEQAAGEPATAASDRYALAVVAYELLTGDKPFIATGFAAVARAHIDDPPPDAPGLPPEAQQVLRRGLAKDPADRWASSRDFVKALDAALVSAPAPAPEAAAPPPTPPPTVATRPMAATPDPAQRRTGTLLAALAAALVIAAGVAIALNGGGDDPGANTKARTTPGVAAKDDKEKATPEPTAESTPEPTPEPTVESTPEPTPEATSETVGTSDPGDPVELQADGFQALEAGDYETAIAASQQAVEACGDSAELDPCGYALYNLGAALNRAGRPDEAILYLEDRLARFGDNENKDVKTELKAARKNARG